MEYIHLRKTLILMVFADRDDISSEIWQKES